MNILRTDKNGTKYIVGIVHFSPTSADNCAQMLSELLDELSMQSDEHIYLILVEFNSKSGQLKQLENIIFNNHNDNESRLVTNSQVNKKGTLLADIMESLGFMVLSGRISGDIPVLKYF